MTIRRNSIPLALCALGALSLSGCNGLYTSPEREEQAIEQRSEERAVPEVAGDVLKLVSYIKARKEHPDASYSREPGNPADNRGANSSIYTARLTVDGQDVQIRVPAITGMGREDYTGIRFAVTGSLARGEPIIFGEEGSIDGSVDFVYAGERAVDLEGKLKDGTSERDFAQQMYHASVRRFIQFYEEGAASEKEGQ